MFEMKKDLSDMFLQNIIEIGFRCSYLNVTWKQQ